MGEDVDTSATILKQKTQIINTNNGGFAELMPFKLNQSTLEKKGLQAQFCIPSKVNEIDWEKLDLIIWGGS